LRIAIARRFDPAETDAGLWRPLPRRLRGGEMHPPPFLSRFFSFLLFLFFFPFRRLAYRFVRTLRGLCSPSNKIRLQISIHTQNYMNNRTVKLLYSVLSREIWRIISINH
jgi:hypothetical protein